MGSEIAIGQMDLRVDSGRKAIPLLLLSSFSSSEKVLRKIGSDIIDGWNLQFRTELVPMVHHPIPRHTGLKFC